MRHGKKFNHLGRKSAHRNAMLANMASSLILKKRINTTLAKAKALRVYVEPLITKSKDDSTHSRRIVFSYLKDKDAVSELFRDIAAKVSNRPGGYTRILRTENRLGDNAEMCFIELVDYNENMLAAKTPSKAKATRRRGTKKKKTVKGEEDGQVESVEHENLDNDLEQTNDEGGKAKSTKKRTKVQKIESKNEIEESNESGKEESDTVKEE
jgi:large subunit ribosomal protein L17